MQALPTLGVAILAAALVTTPAESQWRRGTEYKADRAADAPARGATEVLVTAMSGSLEVIGRPGLSEVRARGTARASREAWLPGIPLTATRRGDAVVVAVDIPDRDRHEDWDNDWRALDLVVEVPEGMAVDVIDGSGELLIRNTGSVVLKDGSGEIRIEGTRGDVRITDGSGSMHIRDVTGSVVVEQDGSGGIDITGVSGSVAVESDGSGSIDVRNVGGDFRVGSDGSGSISHSDVRGQVSVPEKRRGRYRWRHRDRHP